MKTTENATTDGKIRYKLHEAETDREAVMSEFKNGYARKFEFHFEKGMDIGEPQFCFVIRTLIEHGYIGKLLAYPTETPDEPKITTAMLNKPILVQYYIGTRLAHESRVSTKSHVPFLAGISAVDGVDGIYEDQTWNNLQGYKPSGADRPPVEQGEYAQPQMDEEV